MSPVLIVGATRGLGAELVKQYAARSEEVHATTRSDKQPDGFPSGVNWLRNIDLMDRNVGESLAKQLRGSKPLSTVIITAGYFGTEDFTTEKGPSWDAELRMYTTSSIAPVFVVHKLVHEGLLKQGAKVVLVSSEGGSIRLRDGEDGGGNYGHHASKAALNMVGKLLSLDVMDKGIIISLVHPGFMRTEMTKSVGFDKFWDQAGAMTPDEAAKLMIGWTDKLDMSKSGQFWAPRGGCDIGSAEAVMGKNLAAPLELPW